MARNFPQKSSHKGKQTGRLHSGVSVPLFVRIYTAMIVLIAVITNVPLPAYTQAYFTDEAHGIATFTVNYDETVMDAGIWLDSGEIPAIQIEADFGENAPDEADEVRMGALYIEGIKKPARTFSIEWMMDMDSAYLYGTILIADEDADIADWMGEYRIHLMMGHGRYILTGMLTEADEVLEEESDGIGADSGEEQTTAPETPAEPDPSAPPQEPDPTAPPQEPDPSAPPQEPDPTAPPQEPEPPAPSE